MRTKSTKAKPRKAFPWKTSLKVAFDMIHFPKGCFTHSTVFTLKDQKFRLNLPPNSQFRSGNHSVRIKLPWFANFSIHWVSSDYCSKPQISNVSVSRLKYVVISLTSKTLIIMIHNFIKNHYHFGWLPLENSIWRYFKTRNWSHLIISWVASL